MGKYKKTKKRRGPKRKNKIHIETQETKIKFTKYDSIPIIYENLENIAKNLNINIDLNESKLISKHTHKIEKEEIKDFYNIYNKLYFDDLNYKGLNEDS